MYQRLLNLEKLIKENSFFLFGPRGVGKSFLIKRNLPNYLTFDLLDLDVMNSILKRPAIIEEIIPPKTKYVIIDEIQKYPELLNVVHKLIENRQIQFLLTGSSARKLKKVGVNLLGGRAREYHMFPLTSYELEEGFDLLKYLNDGGLPKIYNSKKPEEDKKSYVNLYLKEEVKSEALIRSYDYFVRFLDTMALSNGEELHYANIANDSGVAPRTLENYISVLEDTLLGFQVMPFLQTKKRKAITRSKFYFFDVGITNYLANRGEIKKGSELFGKTLEHFVAMELRAALEYFRRREKLQYWRTKNGYEVDFVIGNKIAIEVKASARLGLNDLKNLKALKEEQVIENYIIVCLEKFARVYDGIKILPVDNFLKFLWKNEY